MKIQSIITVLSSVYLLCVSSAVAQSEPELPKGRLLYNNGSHEDVYIISYRAGVSNLQNKHEVVKCSPSEETCT